MSRVLKIMLGVSPRAVKKALVIALVCTQLIIEYFQIYDNSVSTVSHRALMLSCFQLKKTPAVSQQTIQIL